MRALALLVLLAVAAPAAALSAEITPAAPRAEEPFTVTATPAAGEEIVRAVLRYCVGTPERIAYCYPQLDMAKQGASFAATTETGFPAGETLGWNVTAHGANGSVAYVPADADYVFLTVHGEQADVPLVPLSAAGAALAAALVARGRRRA